MSDGIKLMMETLNLHLINDPFEHIDKEGICKVLLSIFDDESRQLGIKESDVNSPEDLLALMKHGMLMRSFLYYVEKEHGLTFEEIRETLNKLAHEDCMCNQCQAAKRNLN